MAETVEATLDIGDRAPNFVLPDERGTFTMFYERTRGLPVILLFASPRRSAAHRALLDRFAERAGGFEAAAVDIFCVSLDAPDPNASTLPYLVWSDSEQKITQWYFEQLAMAWPPGPGEAGVLALGLDANQRILWIRRGGGADLADQILAELHRRPAPAVPEIRMQTAPVLLVPGVLGPGDLPEGSLDPDPAAIDDPAVQLRLAGLIGRRIAPELYKAFGFQGFRLGRLRLHVRSGPDVSAAANSPPESGKRRFVLLLGLPGDSANPGAVRFPEFGGHYYPLHAGGALIFSEALLWEWETEDPQTRYLQSDLEAASR